MVVVEPVPDMSLQGVRNAGFDLFVPLLIRIGIAGEMLDIEGQACVGRIDAANEFDRRFTLQGDPPMGLHAQCDALRGRVLTQTTFMDSTAQSIPCAAETPSGTDPAKMRMCEAPSLSVISTHLLISS